MQRLGLEKELVDASVYDNTVERFRQQRIALPTFAQLADPSLVPGSVRAALGAVGPDDASPLNLFRVNWYNDPSRCGLQDVPAYIDLPKSLTGVDARIVVAIGDRFPMINAHKVLAAYGCLAPRVITGQFDPTHHRAIWPSTGNYCRGGVAISRIMACRGVAVLPEGMSQERFDWLERWVVDSSDIIRTPGTESNVKEIYDKCNELSLDPENVIFNQFSEFGNHIVHYLATGRALERVFETMQAEQPNLRLRAFISATGSAGTIAAGDYLKEHLGSLTVAVEALECPTLIENGFGEHNIQGIGDKHIPLIHNVMATDVALALSDRATDRLGVLFNTPVGRAYLADRRGVPAATLDALSSLGLSSIANVLGAIKTAKYYEMGPDDVIVTVATDGAAMYHSEREIAVGKYFGGEFDTVGAGEVFGEHILGTTTDNLLELTRKDRERIFNLGYYTWVEQQGVSIEEFKVRKDPAFWTEMRSIVADWDRMIDEFNGRTGVLETL
ncbi:MAG: pyridoxal-5'-phosphate-dependent protein subunit beta [Chloroflexi bacterium]|nr:pyridoxal-5'-phosphate-dependent protein subunit beta [Chloroflexota bacterium]